MRQTKFMTVIDTQEQIALVIPVKVVPTTAKNMDDRLHPCAWCMSDKVVVVRDVIQHGFDRQSHATTFYCPKCLKATTFEYEVRDEN